MSHTTTLNQSSYCAFFQQNIAPAYNVQAYAIPSWDEWYSEYTPENFRRLQFISGFSGSNGIALITNSRQNLLLTDGRYLTQAKMELPNDWIVVDIGDKTELADILDAQKIRRIGCDPFIRNQRLDELFSRYELINISPNLVDEVDGFSRPFSRFKKNGAKLWSLPDNVAGKNAKDKIEEALRLLPGWADGAFIFDSMSISWLLNIRSNDVEYSGNVLAYLLLRRSGEHILYCNFNSNDEDELLISKKKYDDSIHLNFPIISKEYLRNLGISPRPIEEVRDLSQHIVREVIVMEKKLTPQGFYKIQKDELKPQQKNEETEFFHILSRNKAVKNLQEISGFIDAHTIDGIAVSNFIKWIKSVISEDQIAQETVDELIATKKLLSFRQEAAKETFAGSSFNTIMGWQCNGAIIHYRATSKTNRIILQKGEKITSGLLLVDSGAHYHSRNVTTETTLSKTHNLSPNGTTDITRTIVIGNPTTEQITNYTAVLRGHIAAAQSKFPRGTTGQQIDTMARQFLWRLGIDYGHGTGHGVGHILSVHEGPQSLSRYGLQNLLPGMVVSIEPGCYFEGEYGIRLENLYFVIESENEDFLQFQCLTYVPFEDDLIDWGRLSFDERDWLEKYNILCKNLLNYENLQI